MSGDSPAAHVTESFDFGKDDRSSPAPTTSKEIGVQNTGTGVTTASVVVETQKDKDKEKDEDNIDFCSPIANSTDDGGRRGSQADQTLKLEDSSSGGDKNHEKKDKKKPSNGGMDKLDAVPVGSFDDKKSFDQEQNDDCCLKCLSITLECCGNCTIM